MEEEELASLFAAKKENEELKEQIKKLESSLEVSEININSLVVEMGKMEDYRRILDNKLLDKEQELKELDEMCHTIGEKHDRLVSLLKLIQEWPMFWGKKYKKAIRNFLISQGYSTESDGL